MRIDISEEFRRANEMSVGIAYSEQERIPLDSLSSRVVVSKRESERQVASRGTIYLQMGRKVSMDFINKIIKKF